MVTKVGQSDFSYMCSLSVNIFYIKLKFDETPLPHHVPIPITIFSFSIGTRIKRTMYVQGSRHIYHVHNVDALSRIRTSSYDVYFGLMIISIRFFITLWISSSSHSFIWLVVILLYPRLHFSRTSYLVLEIGDILAIKIHVETYPLANNTFHG